MIQTESSATSLSTHSIPSTEPIVIAAFYRFVPLPDYEALREPLKAFCIEHELKGTILLAAEGINSTISGTRENMDALFAYFDRDPRLANLDRKEHIADFKPFQKMKVRLKQEIVRLAVDGLDAENRGEYATSEEWNALLDDPETIVIDTRNDYEVQLGTFKGAVNPKTDEFRSFPKWVEEHLDPQKHKKVAMFCTGGIRCEKSTALLKQQGFEEVYHLKGGILQYLEDTKNKQGKWQGECFVFDDRVAVDDSLTPTKAPLCKHCGQPIPMEGKLGMENNRGAMCGNCL